MKVIFKHISKYALFGLIVFLAACGGILEPKGYVAGEQKKLILTALFVMVGVAIPVFVMALVFAFKYNEKRQNPNYDPNWDHSNKLEVVIWGVPVLIIVFLAILTWKTSHSLDPKKPLDVSVSNKQPVVVQVIALDWKWLFIYPDYGIATINNLVLPVDTPVLFKITSDTAMNAFWIPQLGGMIYAMAAMETNLNLISHSVGVYDGVSSSYSGFGFSGMKFKANIVNDNDFKKWVTNVKSSGTILNANKYLQLSEPSEFHNIELMKLTDVNLFYNVIQKYTNHAVNTAILKH